MKYILLGLFGFFILVKSYSQELISTAGNYSDNSNYSVTWSIGEPIVETLISENNQLTQGFHQTKLTITSITENNGLAFTIFPNPTSETIFIKPQQQNKKFEWTIHDNKGIVIQKGDLKNETQINVNYFNQGLYFLTIQNEQKEEQIFKIIKN